MKLLYIANARIPTEKAHGLQIIKMCEAFVRQGVDVELVVPFRKHVKALKDKNTFEYYGVGKKFKIRKLPVPDLIVFVNFLPIKISLALFHIHALIFSLASLLIDFSFISNIHDFSGDIIGFDNIALVYWPYMILI